MFIFWVFVSEAGKPSSRLVFKLIVRITKSFIGHLSIVTSVINNYLNLTIVIRCFNLNFYVLFLILETVFFVKKITDFVSAKDWFAK